MFHVHKSIASTLHALIVVCKNKTEDVFKHIHIARLA